MTVQYLGSLNLRIGDFDFVHPIYVAPLQYVGPLQDDRMQSANSSTQCTDN